MKLTAHTMVPRSTRWIVAVAAMVLGQAASAAVIFSNLPTTLPPNLPSLGYQATGTTEFGNHILFAPGARQLNTAKVVMSNWALESEYGMGGAGYHHDLTLNIYNYGSETGTGSLITTKTLNAFIPWRPAADPTCPNGTAWRAGDGNCYNGYAFEVVFDFTGMAVNLPNDVVFGLSFNTQTYGNQPIGAAGPYNSLNFALVDAAPTVGTDVDPDSVFWNTAHQSFLTPGGPGVAGVFGGDTNWTGFVPAISIDASTVPEPGALALVALALAGAGLASRRKR